MTIKQELTNYIIDNLNDRLEGIYGCDLHNELFNTDYYFVYYSDAEKFMNEYGGCFKAIHRVKEYEIGQFGEVYTDLSDPIKVANMLVYIEGELIIMELNHMEKIWDKRIETEDIEILKSEIQE